MTVIIYTCIYFLNYCYCCSIQPIPVSTVSVSCCENATEHITLRSNGGEVRIYLFLLTSL